MPEATNESALEKTFSDLAYSHLRDKSQQLLDYLVGFQMLKQEDDGQRAVGIFGFEIDEDFYYAPIFFLNGEIRGLDSLYSVKSDLFIPITDDWVNTIINKRQMSLGDTDTRSRSERGVHVPNYTRLKVIPGGGGAVNLKLSADEAHAKMGGDRGDQFEKISFVQGLAEAGLTPMFKKALAEYPRLQDVFHTFYNELDLYDLPEPQTKVAQEEAVVIINSIADERTSDLTDDQRKELLDEGTVVTDKRPELAKSILYSSETKQRLENPTGGGLYDVLYCDGSVEATIIAPTNTTANCVVVYCPSMDKHAEVDPREVFVVRKYTDQEFHDWMEENAVKASEVTPGSSGIFVSRSGESTGGLCVSEKRTGVDDITVCTINDHYCMTPTDRSIRECQTNDNKGRGNNGNPPQNMYMDLRIGGNGGPSDMPYHQNFSNRPTNDPNCRVKEVLITQEGGDCPRYSERRVVVNDKNFWFLKLNSFKLRKPEWDNANIASTEEEVYGEPKYDVLFDYADFGDYATVSEALDKVATDLKVWKTGRDLNIKVANEDAVTVSDDAGALRYMMVGLGMGEGDARLIMKTANHSPEVYKLRVMPKEAAELLDFPTSEDTDLGGFMTNFHRQQVPYETMNRANSVQNREFYQYYSPFGSGGTDEAENSTFEVLNDAAQTGQKEVFDAAALASLIKNHNPTDLVDRFLPTITAGMDRIGRMLFLVYWHYEDFEERYGDTDLSDLIDNLRSIFEQLGDLVVSLKKRTLAGDPEHYGMGIQPEMEEAV